MFAELDEITIEDLCNRARSKGIASGSSVADFVI
jgi:hypothetical protein